METGELKLHDSSKLEFRWIHHGLLSIERWVPGNECRPADWRLTGCVVLGGADLERFLDAIASLQEPERPAGTRRKKIKIDQPGFPVATNPSRQPTGGSQGNEVQ